MKKVCASLCLLLLAYASASAGVIKGKVVDDLKEALEFVNVAVYQQGSTTPHKGTISDAEGHFTIDGVKDGTYVVKFTFMGYEEQQRTVTLNGSNSHTANLRTITMREDRAVLQEVSVSTQRAAMKLDIDKKVFDVSENIAAAGLSASEALENIPSVEVDQEGNISLRGSSSVTIWINGKEQGMTSDNRGDILQQLPAESIERIEVITNPSSKYSPEGSAGIINIILKRDRKAGYYGGVQVSGGKQRHEDFGGRFGANINYSSGILEAYGNVGLGRRVFGNGSWTDRDYVDSTTMNHYGYLNSRSRGHMKGLNLFGRAGVTWHFTQKDELSVGFMGMTALDDGKRTTSYSYESGIYDEFKTWAIGQGKYFDPYTQQRSTYNTNKPHMYNYSLGYRHEWTSQHTLDVQASFFEWSSDNTTGFDQYRYSDNGMTTDTLASFQRQESTIGNQHYELQIDYVRPLSESSKVEVGYKGTKFHENSPTETWSRSSANDDWASDYGLFNRFIYDQYLHAAYANYQNRIGQRFGYQLGLRGEYWRVETESYNYDQEYGTSHLTADAVPAYEKTFFKLFPTVFLSYQLPANQELQLNYTRRLSRPRGGQLNSFRNINDSTSISYGNPALTPSYTNSFELNYLKNWDEQTLSLSMYYRPTTDVMQQISYMTDGIRYQTNENISQEQSSGLEIIGKNKVFKVINLTTTVNLFYYKLDGGSFYVNDLGRSITVDGDEDFTWNASLMAQVTLPWQLALQATGRYNAPQVITQGKREQMYSLDCGLRRAFFDKKLTFSVNGRNLLNSRRTRSRTSGSGFWQDSESWRGNRRIMVQISYSFGNMVGKDKKRGGEAEGNDSGSGYDSGADE